MKLCCFCFKAGHLSENCDKFKTLESRILRLKLSFEPCFKEKRTEYQKNYFCVGFCKCKNVCDICLQQHFVELCPKKDPNHPLYSENQDDPFNLLNLGYEVVKRFLTLCNPIDKVKLYLTCKYLNQLQQPLEYKLLRSTNHYDNTLNSKVIYNGIIEITRDCDINLFNKNGYVNGAYCLVNNAIITKSDMEIVRKSDPMFFDIQKARLESGFSFIDFLQLFPYTIELKFTYSMLPRTWIADFNKARRNISIRKINIFCDIYFPRINANQLVELLKVHAHLELIFSLWDDNYRLQYDALISAAMEHKDFLSTLFDRGCRVKFMFKKLETLKMYVFLGN